MANTDSKIKAVVYIGPSFRGLSSYSVYLRGQYPPPVKALIEKYPNIAGLMVPVQELQQARKNIRVQGHILHHYLTHLKGE